MVNFGPLAAKIGSVVWGTQANFNGFRVLASLLHGIPAVGASRILGGVEQRAPAIFGRAAITFGIGLHCSFNSSHHHQHQCTGDRFLDSKNSPLPDFSIKSSSNRHVQMHLRSHYSFQLECGPMPNVMARPAEYRWRPLFNAEKFG